MRFRIFTLAIQGFLKGVEYYILIQFNRFWGGGRVKKTLIYKFLKRSKCFDQEC